MRREVPIEKIIRYLNEVQIPHRFIGSPEGSVSGFCSLKRSAPCSLMWIKKARQEDAGQIHFPAGALVVTSTEIADGDNMLRQIITQQPKAVFFSLVAHFWKPPTLSGISSTSVIETDKIGRNVTIGHHCYIGKDVSIGDNTVIEHSVTLMTGTTIGTDCLIHSGAIIGTDGFGFFVDENDGMPVKAEHFGGVIIGNEVEIGANTCIDRGTIDDTVIRDRVKIDNLVHIAHNVIIGEGSMVVALSLLGGSAELGARSYVAPGAIIKNQLHVGEGAFVGMGAVVINDIPAGMIATGVPARVIREVRDGDK